MPETRLKQLIEWESIPILYTMQFPYRFSFKGGCGVSLKTDGSWGSQGSCHSHLASRVGVGSL